MYGQIIPEKRREVVVEISEAKEVAAPVVGEDRDVWFKIDFCDLGRSSSRIKVMTDEGDEGVPGDGAAPADAPDLDEIKVVFVFEVELGCVLSRGSESVRS